MQVSSGPPLSAENIPSPLQPQLGMETAPWAVEDDEFPSELPTHYDRILQPARPSNATGIKKVVVVLLTILLIAISLFVIHKISSAAPSVLASPISPSR